MVTEQVVRDSNNTREMKKIYYFSMPSDKVLTILILPAMSRSEGFWQVSEFLEFGLLLKLFNLQKILFKKISQVKLEKRKM